MNTRIKIVEMPLTKKDAFKIILLPLLWVFTNLIGIAQVTTNPNQLLDLPISSQNQNWDFNSGYRFTANVDGDITQLGGRWTNGVVHTVRLYAYPAGTVLASASVTGSIDWAYTTLGSPVTLTAGNQYVVAVRQSFTSSGLISSNAGLPTSSGGITINNSTFITGTTNMPTNAPTTLMYGQADITFEPCTYAGNITAEAEAIFPGNSTTLTVTDNVGSIQWQSSTNGISFSDLLGETGIALSTGALSTTTFYRTYFTGGGCGGSDTSSSIEIQVLDARHPLFLFNPDIASENENVDINTGYRFTADQDGDVTQLGGRWRNGIIHTVRLYDAATTSVIDSAIITGTGTFTYANITPVSLTAGNEYVVAVRLDAQSSGYFSDFSTPVSSAGITISSSVNTSFPSNAMPTDVNNTQMFGQADLRFDPCTYAGLIVPDNEQLSNGESTTLRLLDNVGSIQWQSSTDNITFTDIPGATSSSLATGPLTQTTLYRTRVTGGSCGPDTSNVVAFSILDLLHPLQATGIEPSEENVNYFNLNMGYQFTPNRNGNVTELGGRWRSGITYKVRLYDVATTSVIDSANITATGDWVYTSITPVALTAGNQYIVAVQLDDQANAINTSVTTPITVGQVTIDNTIFGPTDVMPTSAFTTDMYGQPDIKFIPCVAGGEIEAEDNIVCSGSTTTVIASGATGTIQWQNSTDNITFSDIGGATDSILTTAAITQKTYFRLVASDACGNDTSNVDSVDVLGTGGTPGLWTAFIDDDWNEACNWSDGVVPTSGDSVTIPFGIDPPTGIPTISLEYLQINNATGITLTNDMTITEELVLIAGNVDVGSNILILAPSAIVTGGLSTSYIKVDGTGFVRKEYTFADIGNTFTFPVGNTSDFNPFSVTLNPGTATGGSAYLDIDVISSSHPNIGSAASFISKYWSVAVNDIANLNYNVTGTYSDADINGTEGDMTAHQFNLTDGWTSFFPVNTATNSFTANSITSFGDFTASSSIAIVSAGSGDWNSGSTWVGITVPNSTSDAVIQSPHEVSLTSDESVNSLTINTGGILRTDGNILSISGDLTVNGTYDDPGRIEFVGSGAQTIEGMVKFDDITINNANGVSVTSGTHLIAGTLTLTNGIFNTNNSITLTSDAVKTARIAEITGGSITGNITVQRYIDAGATNWRFLSPPVSGATLADIDDDVITSGFTGSEFPDFGFINILFYDEIVGGTSDNGFVNASNITEPIGVGEGIWVWSGDNNSSTTPFTFDFTGPANTGNIILPVTYTNTGSTVDDGWNMVGNPYASTIDWDDVSITRTNVDNAIYVWDPDEEQYASYVGGMSANGGSKHIASAQAFWVKANAASPDLILTEASKDPTAGTFFKQGATSTANPLIVNIQNSFGTDQTIINFQTNATNSFDGAFDAYKIASRNPDRPYISSLISNNETEYAINQIPQQETEVLIKILANTSGVHTINFTGVTNFSNSCVILEDLFTGNTYDLTTTSSLSAFISDTTTVARFILKLGTPISTINNISCHGNDDGTIFLEKNSTQAFDVIWKNSAGSLIATHTNINGVDSITNLSAGTYIIEAIDESCGDIIDTITLNNPLPINAEFTVEIDTLVLSGYNDSINFTNLSNNANAYTWDFDDGNTSSDLSPTHQYQENGVYAVTLTATQNENCIETFTKNIVVLDNATSINEVNTTYSFSIYPNPLTGNHLNIVFNGPENNSHIRFQIIDMTGKMVYQRSIITQHAKGNIKVKVDRKLPKGSYIVKMITPSNTSTQTLIVK